MSIQKFAFPTAIHFGAGASSLVAEHLRSVGVSRPLIVTDRALAALPVTTTFAQKLRDGGLALDIYSGIWGNPLASMVKGGVDAYRAHRADAVIGFGGGAALDVAKVVAMMATNAGDDVLEYAWDHPLCDGIALEGVRIAARALPLVVAEPRNIEARSDMMMASMMGAIAFQKDLGAVHSCAHALSTVADLHHGLANGIMLDHVLRFNVSAATAKMAELARVAKVPGARAMSDERAAQAFIEWIGELKATLGIPGRLGEVGVKSAHIEALTDIAINDICHQTNPRPCTREDFARIFAEAL